MKKLQIKYLFGGLFLSAMALFTACSSNEDVFDPISDVVGLKVDLTIGDASVASKVTSKAETSSDNSMKEDVINDLNVFFFNADGSCQKQYYLTSGLASGVDKLLASASTWTADFTPGKTFTVYAVANNGGDMGVKTLSALQAVQLSDVNIYKPYNASTNVSKSFKMDGNTTWTAPTTGTGNDVVIPLNLKRAAAKVILKVGFSSSFQSKLTLGSDWMWAIKNYGSKASLLDGTVLTDKGMVATSDVMTQTPEAKTATTTITTYSYQNVWDAATDQTMVEVNIPCVYDGHTYATNKYLFPVTSLRQTDRNMVYEMDVTLDHLGNTNEPESYNLKYAVQPWITHDIDISNVNINYLIVSPDTVRISNVTTNSDIHFYSSKDVTVTINEAYYYNSNGVKTAVDSSIFNSITKSLSGTRSGAITLTSPIPTNLGPRYISLTVSNGISPSKNVLVIQYPLEYITSITGNYSYKDDGNGKQVLNSWNPTLSGTKRYTQGSANSWSDTNAIGYYSFFNSKYYENNTIYFPNGYRSGNISSSASSGQDNNHMYVVRITSTSSKYTIDKPIITNGITDGSAANNNVVSPAFMIASQLGTVTATNWSQASSHCKAYVEVNVTNGVTTKYDDWRLPTLAELAIISLYQNAGQDVIYEVLGGNYYWSAYNVNGSYGYYGTGNDGGSTGYKYTTSTSTSCYIRCIRDMKPSELTNQ